MSLRSHAMTAVTLVIAVFVAAMLIGQVLGVPIGLGYVETGSMEPTLSPNDGFVALPPLLAGEITAGDVITFDAQELAGGGLTTHRVVEVTPEGYITQGDNNLVTDQDGDEPVVTDDRVASVVLQLNGEVVRIPQLGLLVSGLQGLVLGFAGLLSAIPGVGLLLDAGVGGTMTLIGVLIIVASLVSGALRGDERRVSRSRRREGYLKFSVILLVLLTMLLLPLTASMVLPSGTFDTTIVSSSSPGDNPTVIGVGESESFPYEVTNNGIVPKLVLIEPASTGVTVDETTFSVGHGETASTTVTLYAPEETGAYVRSVSERHYAMVLPTWVIVPLHDIHPWLAIIAINLFVALIVTVVIVALVGFQPLRLRSTNREVPLMTRVKRYLR